MANPIIFKLVKLLYLADRLALLESEHPISGDNYCSMKNGPVLSKTFDLIKNKSDHGEYWLAHIETSGFQVKLVNDPGVKDLSKFEINVLDRVYEKYGHIGRWNLVDLTHELPEWENPGTSSKPIRIDTILTKLGYNQEDIHRITSNLEYEATIYDLLKQHRCLQLA